MYIVFSLYIRLCIIFLVSLLIRKEKQEWANYICVYVFHAIFQNKVMLLSWCYFCLVQRTCWIKRYGNNHAISPYSVGTSMWNTIFCKGESWGGGGTQFYAAQNKTLVSGGAWCSHPWRLGVLIWTLHQIVLILYWKNPCGKWEPWVLFKSSDAASWPLHTITEWAELRAEFRKLFIAWSSFT